MRPFLPWFGVNKKNNTHSPNVRGIKWFLMKTKNEKTHQHTQHHGENKSPDAYVVTFLVMA